jgi:hypothetical protein
MALGALLRRRPQHSDKGAGPVAVELNYLVGSRFKLPWLYKTSSR